LLHDILTGALKPGEAVSAPALAAQKGVSRTPVQEAIQRLTRDGLVEQKPNRRRVVATFTARDVDEIYDMRILLESEAAARAAVRIDRPTVNRLADEAAAAQRLRVDERRTEKWLEHDEALHKAIANASGSRRLADEIARYHRLRRAINILFAGSEMVDLATPEHLEVLKALERRDAEAARAAMRAHLSEWRAYFVRRIEDRADHPG
jgi:DNA-binding GntR family transcriptional regulator